MGCLQRLDDSGLPWTMTCKSTPTMLTKLTSRKDTPCSEYYAGLTRLFGLRWAFCGARHTVMVPVFSPRDVLYTLSLTVRIWLQSVLPDSGAFIELTTDEHSPGTLCLNIQNSPNEMVVGHCRDIANVSAT
jgi:hypothetical protein